MAAIYIYIEYWIIDNILKVHVHKGFLPRPPGFQHETPRFFSEFAKVFFLFGERNGESLFSWWDGLSALIFFLLDEVRTFWIVIGRHAAKNRPKHYIVIKWSWTPNHDSGPGFSDCDLQRIFCESLAKLPRKRRKRRCPWKPVAHTAPSQRQVKGTL